MSVKTSIDLKADVPAVWAKLLDLENQGTWVASHAGFVGGAPSALTPGAEYTERVKVLGMPNDVTWTINVVEEGRRLAQEGKGPMGITIDAEYNVEPTSDGVRLTISQGFSGAALFAVKGQLEREVKATQESSLAKFKELVEVA